MLMISVPLVQVYEVEGSGAVKLLCSNVILGSDRPLALHGGAILGVAFDRKIKPGIVHLLTPDLVCIDGSSC